MLHSSRSAARYSIARDRWEPLPDLPAGRSSHDAVVAGGVLYVVGGWELRGPDEDAVWADTVLALDLENATDWREIPAPFRRRALAAGAAGGRIHALGGLTPDSGPVLRVDVLDIATGAWSRGPDLPQAGSLQGFGAAAASHHDRVFMSQADGKVYSLGGGADSWELVAILADRRFMHRLASFGNRLLAVGGAWGGSHLATIEVVSTGNEAPDERSDDREPEQRATRSRPAFRCEVGGWCCSECRSAVPAGPRNPRRCPSGALRSWSFPIGDACSERRGAAPWRGASVTTPNRTRLLVRLGPRLERANRRLMRVCAETGQELVLPNSVVTPGVAAGRLPVRAYEENFADLRPPLTAHEATVAAGRCYFCHDAPCVTACPTASTFRCSRARSRPARPARRRTVTSPGNGAAHPARPSRETPPVSTTSP